MKQSVIVIGLGFGDEGKGVTTDFLCRQAERPLVVRFSGGHQAGHTVTLPDGRSHVFSNFGAGTLSGAPTFWSRYCTFYPTAFANERAALLEHDFTPVLFADGRCPVTTPYDLLYNRQVEKDQQHGSCGLGFGATVSRHEGPHKIHVMDLLQDFVLEQKLASVRAYYEEKLGIQYQQVLLDQLLEDFWRAVEIVRQSLVVISERAFFLTARDYYDAIIFEGSQGLLLDEEFGYFPHVTRAKVSSVNALAIIRENELPAPEMYYVSRAYQTRHGNGPLSNVALSPPALLPTPDETNVYNPWQGEQRRSLLDLDQLKYAIAADGHYCAGLERYLVITCLDQLSGAWMATENGSQRELLALSDLPKRLGGTWKGVFGNYGRVGQLEITENVLAVVE